MLPVVVLKKFWENNKKADDKRISGQQKPEGVTEITDIPYLKDGNRFHLLDVYYPEGSENEKLPVIIDIHGGGWMYGDKELNKYYNMSLAKKGFTVFSISYSLFPDVTVPEQLREAAEALSFINSSLDSYPCDKSKIMLTGDSAGGQLALYTAVLLRSSVLRGVFSVKDAALKITCLALTSPVPNMNGTAPMGIYTKMMWGKNFASNPTSQYMNFSDIMKFAKLPPTYLVTSSGDSLARKQTRDTYNMIKSLGVKAKLSDWEKTAGKNLPHVFSVLDPFCEEGNKAIDDMLDFFRETY